MGVVNLSRMDPGCGEAHLLVLTKAGGSEEGDTFALERGVPYAVGRRPSCCGAVGGEVKGIFFTDDGGLSRHHATLMPTREGWRVIDEDSTNGTAHNERAIKDALLAEGDRIRFGGVEVLFRTGPAGDAPSLGELRARFAAHRPVAPLSIIVAVGERGAIGGDGKLPWTCAEDRAFFESTTAGHAVIMGRRTWEEAGRPLEGRTTIVLSRTFVAQPGAHVARTFDDALELARRFDPSPFVLGGVAVFHAALPHTTRVYRTRIPGWHHGVDRFFSLGASAFTLIERGVMASAKGDIVFETLERATAAPASGRRIATDRAE